MNTDKGGEESSMSLLVRNLRYETNAEKVREFFERFGEIRDVYLPKDYHTKRPRGFGFVEFYDDAAAHEALEKTHKEFLDGNQISVIVAQQGRKSPDTMRVRTREESRDDYGSYHRGRRGGSPYSHRYNRSPSPYRRRGDYHRRRRSYSPLSHRHRNGHHRSHDRSPSHRRHRHRRRSPGSRRVDDRRSRNSRSPSARSRTPSRDRGNSPRRRASSYSRSNSHRNESPARASPPTDVTVESGAESDHRSSKHGSHTTSPKDTASPRPVPVRSASASPVRDDNPSPTTKEAPNGDKAAPDNEE